MKFCHREYLSELYNLRKKKPVEHELVGRRTTWTEYELVEARGGWGASCWLEHGGSKTQHKLVGLGVQVGWSTRWLECELVGVRDEMLPAECFLQQLEDQTVHNKKDFLWTEFATFA